MYCKLEKLFRSHQMRNKFNRLIQGVNSYHNGSSYYGYRPKPAREWKSKG